MAQNPPNISQPKTADFCGFRDHVHRLLNDQRKIAIKIAINERGGDHSAAITLCKISEHAAAAPICGCNPGEVFADSAYRGNHFCDAVRAKGGIPRIVATGMSGRDEQEALRVNGGVKVGHWAAQNQAG
ncbi:hypothetical protein [Sphingobium sp. EM0848]|uniref:hypothetical protein n=1 Tax=Sphingobium sp. EM0848 TaxID=2743473 RepID=UPI001C3F8AFA|nr:hypothetical protein [Sphingobium sp. EM0848]